MNNDKSEKATPYLPEYLFEAETLSKNWSILI